MSSRSTLKPSSTLQNWWSLLCHVVFWGDTGKKIAPRSPLRYYGGGSERKPRVGEGQVLGAAGGEALGISTNCSMGLSGALFHRLMAHSLNWTICGHYTFFSLFHLSTRVFPVSSRHTGRKAEKSSACSMFREVSPAKFA